MKETFLSDLKIGELFQIGGHSWVFRLTKKLGEEGYESTTHPFRYVDVNTGTELTATTNYEVKRLSHPNINTAFQHASLAIEAGDGITAAQLLKSKWKHGTEHEREALLQLARLRFNDASYTLLVTSLA